MKQEHLNGPVMGWAVKVNMNSKLILVLLKLGLRV
jgi:hypothetical protein